MTSFFVFTGSLDKLHRFLDDIIHENIKFTMSHTKPAGASGCECEEQSSIPFLDRLLEIKNRKIISDLYRKPSDRNKHLPVSQQDDFCIFVFFADICAHKNSSWTVRGKRKL